MNDRPTPFDTILPLRRRIIRDPLKFISPATWGDDVPEREWLIEDWLPIGGVVVMFGDGGVGKSLSLQQLGSAAEIGGYWFGLKVEQCDPAIVLAEDDEKELKRRQRDINAALKCQNESLAGLSMIAGAGRDCVMFRFDRNAEGGPTDLWNEFREHVETKKKRLFILDSRATTVIGNPNDDAVAFQVLREMTSLSLATNGVGVLAMHPSRPGLQRGDGYSVGWSNHARARLFLDYAERDKDTGLADPESGVTLTRMKANYAPTGEQLRAVWRKGVFWPEALTQPGRTPGETQAFDQTVLAIFDKLARRGMRMSPQPSARNYAGRLIFDARGDGNRQVGKHHFAAAVGRLIDAGVILPRGYGHPSDGTTELVRATRGG
jgi:RecA-family ATPase